MCKMINWHSKGHYFQSKWWRQRRDREYRSRLQEQSYKSWVCTCRVSFDVQLALTCPWFCSLHNSQKVVSSLSQYNHTHGKYLINWNYILAHVSSTIQTNVSYHYSDQSQRWSTSPHYYVLTVCIQVVICVFQHLLRLTSYSPKWQLQ